MIGKGLVPVEERHKLSPRPRLAWYDNPMKETTALSPQDEAQVVLNAYLGAPGPCRFWVAAALRAAADQVVPANGSRKNNEIRAELLAIATELEAHG